MDKVSGFTYSIYQKPFVDYFNRMLENDNTFYDIELQFPYLEKYYHEMVVNKTHDFCETFITLYENWKLNLK